MFCKLSARMSCFSFRKFARVKRISDQLEGGGWPSASYSYDITMVISPGYVPSLPDLSLNHASPSNKSNQQRISTVNN